MRRRVFANPHQPWKYLKIMKCRATAKKGWEINYFWVLFSLNIELQILKIYFKYLSASILACCYFQGCEIFMVGSSCADLAILSVVGISICSRFIHETKDEWKLLEHWNYPLSTTPNSTVFDSLGALHSTSEGHKFGNTDHTNSLISILLRRACLYGFAHPFCTGKMGEILFLVFVIVLLFH